MPDLVVIVYPTEAKADEMRTSLFSLQDEFEVSIGNAVIAVKREDGKIKLNQLLNATVAGALSTGFWGTLVGMILVVPLTGGTTDAASGSSVGALSDYAINDDFRQLLAKRFQSGNAALFVEIKKMREERVLDAIKATGGVMLKTSLWTVTKAKQEPSLQSP